MVYTFLVSLVSGPVTEEFARCNPHVARSIQMLGSHTLTDLHQAIFDAFDREDDHLYEFQFGKRADDPKGQRYTLAFDDPFPVAANAPKPLDVRKTRIDSLKLRKGRIFGYRFDFGDDWFHHIKVMAIAPREPRVKYPRQILAVGESPPQYLDPDEE
jgi:hypothetical protein